MFQIEYKQFYNCLPNVNYVMYTHIHIVNTEIYIANLVYKFMQLFT